MSIESVMPSNHLIFCHPCLLLSSIFPSSRVFSSESVLRIRCQSIELQHQSFQWIFRTDFLWIDWFDLLAVQGNLRSLIQHHTWKASILWHSAFFLLQLSHPYMTIGKAIALTIWTFVDKRISLLSHMLSRFVIAFLPRCKCLLISWLQSPSAVTLEPRILKLATVSTVSPSISHEVMQPDLRFLTVEL